MLLDLLQAAQGKDKSANSEHTSQTDQASDDKEHIWSLRHEDATIHLAEKSAHHRSRFRPKILRTRNPWFELSNLTIPNRSERAGAQIIAQILFASKREEIEDKRAETCSVSKWECWWRRRVKWLLGKCRRCWWGKWAVRKQSSLRGEQNGIII